MTDTSDADLLERFTRENSAAAFTVLVERHIGLVHSVALRHTADPQQAQDITQAVFIILARKAAALNRQTVLPGWLYHTVRLTAANVQRAESRRIHREQEAYMQSTLDENSAPDAVWQQLAPLLDEAMARLGARDRDALVLRYFQNKSLAEVGAALGLEERTAQKRVARALEKLRVRLVKRGVTLTATVIAGAVAANSVQAAPVALVKTIPIIAVAKGAAAGTATLTLVKGVLKLMAWTKIQTAIVVGVGVLLVAGTTTFIVAGSNSQSPLKLQPNTTIIDTSWQVPRLSFNVLERASPQTQIVTSKFDVSGGCYIRSSMGAVGIAQPIEEIANIAYQGQGDLLRLRMIKSPGLPDGKYDFITKLADNEQPQEYQSNQLPESLRQEQLRILAEQNTQALKTWTKNLQDELKSKLGIVAHREMRDADVLLLKVRNPRAGGIKPESDWNIITRPPNWEELNGDFGQHGEVWFFDRPITDLVEFIEARFRMPVVNQTGLTNTYDFSIKWSEQNNHQRNNEGMKKAMLDQLGLELIPTNMPIEMLDVEKVK
jgi:uncharacterized protein (TIGR03435 family)